MYLSSSKENTRISTDSEFGVEELIICLASIIVSSLDRREWCSVSVTNLKPKEWRPEILDRLVLDQEKEDTLAKTNSRRVQCKKSVDIIEGKGCAIHY